MKELSVNRVELSFEIDRRSFYLSFEPVYNAHPRIKIDDGDIDLVLNAKRFYIFVSDFYCEYISKDTSSIEIRGRVRGNFGKYSSMDNLVKEAL